MPCDYRRYPGDWKEISRRIRFERAQGRCEWCKAPNGELVYRAPGGFWMDESLQWHDKHGERVCVSDVAEKTDYSPEGIEVPKCRTWASRVVLTVAHLGTPHPDGTPGDKHNKMDVRDENLAALCQSCHLTYDHADHIRHGKQTRFRRKAVGTLPGL